jgi:hypothetical protein
MSQIAGEPALAFQTLIGLTPWNVSLGYGSFLTMEFGEEVVQEFRGKSHTHGEWHLWLRGCAWRIQSENRIVIASADERDVVARAINRLKLGALEKVDINRMFDLLLVFSAGFELLTFTNNRYRDEQWELFKPDGLVLIASAGGTLIERSAGKLE